MAVVKTSAVSCHCDPATSFSRSCFARCIGAVATVVSRAKLAAIGSYEESERLSDPDLERRLYGARCEPASARDRPLPDFGYLHAERRRPGVTLQLLHLEYLEQHSDGYRYSQFWDRYRSWLGRQRVTMRQVHRGGRRCLPTTAARNRRSSMAAREW